MQIERHELPDGAESIIKKVFAEKTEDDMLAQLAKAHEEAVSKKTLREVKQTRFDPDDPCPCGSKRKAKNCCAGRLLKRLELERAIQEKKENQAS